MGAIQLSEEVTEVAEGTENTEDDADAQPESQGDEAGLPALKAVYGRGKVHWRVIALKRVTRPPRGFMAPR